MKFPFMFQGYYNNPEATAKAFDEDGWFRSDDFGFLDEDGYIYLKDRKKEVFKYRG